MSRLRRAILASPLAALAFLAACSTAPTSPGTPAPAPTGPDPDVLPAIDREFRGLWVATVANIDWPSRSGLPADQQRAELLSIMDRAVTAGLNAIVLHVRPAGDALYQSSLEPWGAMLTGTQGTDPGYDPLAFAVAEAHRRGLELHAWVNPFRAGNSADTAKLAPTHLFRTRRDLVRVYGTQLWMDPGEPAVRDHSVRVIRDIVARYDVDAVHLDDYFYPYPQGTLPFPDDASFASYGNGGTLDDWRRANVDGFVERLYREVHDVKPWVRVGISPFGIWRPGNPAGITGLDPYTAIYADSRKWLVNGWVDYFAPQLYWRIDPPQQSFTALLDWWLSQNPRGRFVWPGLASYKVYDANPYPVSEIVNQVKATRASSTKGLLFYNTTATLSRNGGELASTLAQQVFTKPALPPATTWLDAQPPAPPAVSGSTIARGAWRGTLTPAAGEPVRFYVVRYRQAKIWTTRIVSGEERELTLTSPTDATVDWVVINAVDRVGNISADVTWRSGS